MELTEKNRRGSSDSTTIAVRECCMMGFLVQKQWCHDFKMAKGNHARPKLKNKTASPTEKFSQTSESAQSP